MLVLFKGILSVVGGLFILVGALNGVASLEAGNRSVGAGLARAALMVLAGVALFVVTVKIDCGVLC